MAGSFPNVANLIIEKMAKWNDSIPIVQESTSAIRNYVRKVEYARLLRTDSVDVLVSLARDPKFDKVRTVIGQALKLMTRVSELDNRIKMKNATDLL